MPIHFIQPFRQDRNLGFAYNEAMALIPDGDYACIRDIDTLFLTPNTPNLIQKYIDTYPDAVLTCLANRVSHYSKLQLYQGVVNDNPDIIYHGKIALDLEQQPIGVRRITSFISGFLMVVSKKIWRRFPFPETGKCLGVDTDWSKKLIKNGVPIYSMQSVYLWHTYRLFTNVSDKSHLKV